MGIFRKLGDWLTDKSDHFVRGGEQEAGYYASQEAFQAYGGTGEPEGEESAREPLDPFGHGNGEYGGRKPYRSRYDLEREAAEQAASQQAQMQQMQPTVNPQAAPQMQQPVQSMPPQQQTAYPPQQSQQASNVVPFPGMQHSVDGSVYAHVEYVVLLRSRNECKDVIAYIKANASVFLNMEFIASDSERQRCVDMLSGAAYTLGCALNKISPRGIYLISSPSVRVVLDPAMQKFTAAPEAQGFVRQQYESESYQPRAYAQETQRQQPASSFSAGSPTSRFQAQGTQRMPTSFGSVMAGNATGMYQPVQPTGRYASVQQ